MKSTLTLNQFHSILFCATLCLLVSCGKKEDAPPPKIDPAFTGYVSAFTSGVISNESSIIIDLREEVAGAEQGKAIDKELFDFSPDIEGQAYWISNRSIEFRPAKILPSGKLFDGKFYLSKLIDVPDKLKTLPLQFQTMQQHINVSFAGLSAYDNKELSWQQLMGTFNTSDFAEDQEVEKALSAVQSGKKMKINWEHNGKTHNFTVDSLRRTENKESVILQWNGESIGSKDESEQIVNIPPLGDFEVMDFMVTQQPDQFITLYFSDPLKENQDLEGLIRLKSGVGLKFAIEGNIVKAYPESRISQATSLIVEQGVRNSIGYQLKTRFEKEVKFSNIKPNVALIGDGVILPSSNGLIFPFKAVNLNAVNVKVIKVFEDNVAQFLQVNQYDGNRQMKRVGRIVYKGEIQLTSNKSIDFGVWNNFSLDLSDLISTEPGAIYRVSISFEKSQSLYPCEEDGTTEEEDISLNFTDPEETSYDAPGGYYDDDYDYYYDDEYYDDYNYSDRDNPCKSSYYSRNNHVVTRNVLASDLGIIAKGGNGNSLSVAVTDLTTTQYMTGVNVRIFNYQNQLIGSGTTDEEGLVSIDLRKKPFLLVASIGKQKGYLRLDDGSALSLSMFDVGGEQSNQGIKGFIYGERGVWRPGDSLYVSFVIQDKNKVLPSDHPVVFDLYTPENQLYLRKVRTQSVNGFYDFRTATTQDAPTGNWLAKVKVGGTSFTKTIKIETVKPNRLKVKLDFGQDILKSGEETSGNLEVKWLHGAIAKDLKADVNVTLSQGKTTFDNFKDYNFDDPAKKFESEEQTVFEGTLNEEGIARISTSFNVTDNAPGMLNASFKIRAFEQGGDFSVDRFTVPYSAYKSYAGVKIPEGKGWNSALYSNESNLIPIVTVDENGKPVNRQKVKIEVFEVSWRWWWERSEDNDLASYIRNQSSKRLLSSYVDTQDGKALYEMNFNQNTWGRKYIKVTDPVSGHSTGAVFYTSYRGWWNNSGQDNPGGAEMLTFKTDKSLYNVGETVSVELPANDQGKALVSIESGSKVIQTFWVQGSTTNNTFTFEATPEMAPNVYVHISYLQPHNQVKNDLPIRLYGVQNIAVENVETHLQPTISMPDVLEPEENVTIKISETNGRKMTYTLAMVDDGLLDLTRFKTPDAWRNFYSREALGVKTWDMYKYVSGAFTGEMAGLLAIGGDEELANKDGGKKANRFKPVVKFFGPIELDAGETKTHTFKMPNYVGSVRTMVVAGNDGAYGSTDKTSPVKKPLMVLATLPRVVGPAETVKLPVTVFAMDKKVKNVSVEIKPNEFLLAKNGTKKSIRFDSEGDQVVYFDIEVAEITGIGRVKVIATSGGEKAEYDIELDVRLPNPSITRTIDGIVEPGQSWTSDYQPVGIVGTNSGVVEVSSLPPLNLENRLKYLIQYPHGCIEQTTSSVFPQLHLTSLLDLNNEDKDKIEANIKAGIDRLKSFQINSGGLSYWPSEYNEASDWGTNYAGHFMLEAKAKGYTLPLGFMKNWIKYQKTKANEWDPRGPGTQRHYYNSNHLIQAYRLYTLALAEKPALGAMNRMRELPNLSVAAKWRLAAAYHLVGRTSIANDMLANLTTKIEPYKELSYSYGSDVRDQAMVLETLVLMDRKVEAKKVMDELVEQMASTQWYSTQTVAYTLLAVAKFVGNTDASGSMKFEYTLNRQKGTSVTSETPISQVDLDIENAESGKVKIKNNSQKTLFVKIQLDGIPLTGDQTSAENDLKMSISYLDMDGNAIDPSSLEQGTDFIAEVTIGHPGVRIDYKEMALTQIFPSGWEIRNLRMDEVTSSVVADQPRYQDIRDDRVLSYFDLPKGKSKTFRVLLNAAYLGRFYLPTVYCEAMYDNEINASRAGQWVNVTSPGGTTN